MKNKYIYNYADHLRNTRLSYFKNAGSSAETLEENGYYPCGLKHEGYNALARNPSYHYKYNGKELQETGQYDYGARMYMPDIGRWGVVDPMAEDMRRYSPYNYAFDNPVNFIDPDGNAPYNPKDFYGSNSAFSDDFDPNTTIMYGNGSFGGYKYYEMGFMYDGSGGNGADTYKGQEAYDVLQNFLNPATSGNSLSPWMQNYLNGYQFTGSNHAGSGENPAAPWFFDGKGKELLNHWLGGSGTNLNFEYDKGWSDYMSKNGFMKDELTKRAIARSYTMYSEGQTKYSEASGNFPFEIDNTYNTGYGMLHGTKYFSYTMNGKYDKSTDSYIFSFDLRWKDQINHNKNVFMDRVFNGITRAVAHPADYWITIKWTQTITVKSKEWERLR